MQPVHYQFFFDLGADDIWDFADAKIFHLLLSLTEHWFIDIWFGGPPCATVSAARFLEIPGGPRPVRSRENFWGLQGLSGFERQRVASSNQRYINFMALCEAASSRGGARGWEHPDDREVHPYPSIFATT